MKILKCAICWICLAVLCLYAFPLSNRAHAESYYMGSVTWYLEDGRLTVAGKGSMADASCPWGVDKDSITEVVIEAGVTGIGKEVFKGFNALTKVTIGEGLTFIEDSAFENCRKLESISLPASIERIGSGAFKNCYKLNTVHIADIGSWCGVELENYSSSPFVNSADLYVDGQLIRNLVIPEGCESISPYAFQYCRSLETVHFPDGLKSIRRCAFSRCYNLKRVNLPGSLTLIGYYAFNECPQLRTVMYRGRIGQLRKLHIDADQNDTFLRASWQMGTGYTILFSFIFQLVRVGIPVGFAFLILHIRKKRRGY